MPYAVTIAKFVEATTTRSHQFARDPSGYEHTRCLGSLISSSWSSNGRFEPNTCSSLRSHNRCSQPSGLTILLMYLFGNRSMNSVLSHAHKSDSSNPPSVVSVSFICFLATQLSNTNRAPSFVILWQVAVNFPAPFNLILI